MSVSVYVFVILCCLVWRILYYEIICRRLAKAKDCRFFVEIIERESRRRRPNREWRDDIR